MFPTFFIIIFHTDDAQNEQIEKREKCLLSEEERESVKREKELFEFVFIYLYFLIYLNVKYHIQVTSEVSTILKIQTVRHKQKY